MTLLKRVFVKLSLFRIFWQLLSVSLGIVLAALGINGFLLPNYFIDGGVTGTSMLVASIFNVELSLIILFINIPFVLIGIRQLNLIFALRSALAIVGLALAVHFISFPMITQDKLLCAIFGGLSLGAGIGLAFRGGAALDGTEILAIILSKRFGFTVGDIILALNVIIFSVGAFFLGLEPALYSVLTYVSASKAIDFLVYGFDHMGVYIIANNTDALKKALVDELGLGVTVYRGKRGVTNQDQDILFCLCSRLVAPNLKELVASIDSQAFITIHKVTDSYGGVLKRNQHFF